MATDIPMNEVKKVVYSGTELNAFSVAGCEWRKPYNITIPTKPTGVARITVTRSASESNCGQLSTTSITSTTTGGILYGDTLSVGATAATGYNNPTASFTLDSSISNNKVTGDVTVSITAGTGKTYYVYYNKGIATSGTLPSTQSRIYPNKVTLGTNNMTKDSTVMENYTVTLDPNGGSCSISSLTASYWRHYTAWGWTKTSGSGVRDYSNGATLATSDANIAADLTLYPCFTNSYSTSSITLPTPTRSNYSFKGWAESTYETSGTTGTYTPNKSCTLYAIWELSPTNLSITFPEITKKTQTVYTTEGSTGKRIFNAFSSTVTYSGYNNYSTCTIDGVTVGKTYTTIKTSGSGSILKAAPSISLDVGTDSYMARFNNGVLEIYTFTQFVGTSTTTSAVLAASSYTTTATFSGEVSVTVLDRKLASTNPSFTNSSAGETITLSGYPNEISYALNSGSQTMTYYGWSGQYQESANNWIGDYDDLYDYDDSMLRIYYCDYEALDDYYGEDQFIDAGIEPVFKLRLKDGYWEQLE